jgi:hypothetical protein
MGRTLSNNNNNNNNNNNIVNCELVVTRWQWLLCMILAVPLEAWGGLEGSRGVKVPRFLDNGTGCW